MDNREFESFNDIINRMNLTILEHGYLNTGREWQFYDLESPFNRMYFVLSGKGRIYNALNSVPLADGRVYIVPLGQTFNYVCDDELVMFYIHFRIELIAGNDLFDGYKYCVDKLMDVSVIESLINHARNSSLSDLLFCKGLFYQYVGKFVEPFSEDLIDHMNLMGVNKQVFELVKEQPFADLRIKHIAEKLEMNPSTLSKAFKSSTGMTLKSYIDQKIIQHAQEQLLVSELTIKDIAYKLHFSDEFRFSRFFKKHTGKSPSIYRQRNNTFK